MRWRAQVLNVYVTEQTDDLAAAAGAALDVSARFLVTFQYFSRVTAMKIRIILADDHPALLAGIQHQFSNFPTLEVVGLARESGELISLLEKVPCDVVVTDYAMPGGRFSDGMALILYLRRTYPNIKLIVFTAMDNGAISQELAKLGVHAVLNKVNDTNHLVSAIHAAYAGSTYYRPNQARTARPEAEQSEFKPLSRRELEVIRLYISGLSVQEIADQLHRTKQTISSQKSSAMRKLDITRDADLFRFAYEISAASQEDISSSLLQRPGLESAVPTA
ncbi:response regulator transcription factor [Bordetella avium]|uniref:response regulator transcription factor n=1 Tax=Bordetella avium TaxID=521 RepID=UPI001F341479|nr:response regulator transcription factor [Bordetella avium]